MSALSHAVEDYLSVRRALGYKLAENGRLLPDFVAYLEAAGASTVSTELAVAWATQPDATARRCGGLGVWRWSAALPDTSKRSTLTPRSRPRPVASSVPSSRPLSVFRLPTSPP